MPLLSPLADFTGVGGLAIAGVGYDRCLRFVRPLLPGFLAVCAAAVAVAAILA